MNRLSIDFVMYIYNSLVAVLSGEVNRSINK